MFYNTVKGIQKKLFMVMCTMLLYRYSGMF